MGLEHTCNVVISTSSNKDTHANEYILFVYDKLVMNTLSTSRLDQGTAIKATVKPREVCTLKLERPVLGFHVFESNILHNLAADGENYLQYPRRLPFALYEEI